MADSDRVITELLRVTREGAIGLMINLQGELSRQTPVDTGWAANNWIPSLGTPVAETVGTPAAVDSSAITQGISVFGAWKIDRPAYLRNNVPYIERLNEGSSDQQATPGFVDRAILTEVEAANRRG